MARNKGSFRPKNSLGLRPGAVEVSNAAGTVLLDKPYLFTEVNQNTPARQPVIVSQNELKKFQELEIEPEIEVTENENTEEVLVAQNEDEQNEEVKQIIQDEIFGEDEELSDLVVDTLVTALSKDDGGITAQLLGKSFLNSGKNIPRSLIPEDVKNQLPEGLDINSPEADDFFANELQNELEKVMLISARIENVDFVPTELNQFSAGLNDIKVPIVNDQTGDVVFLEMGDIDLKPQFANIANNGGIVENFIPEQIILRGQNEIAIDLERGQIFEQQIDPQMEELNQRFETALISGASPEELDQIIYNRKIKGGRGEAVCGLEVLKGLHYPSCFINNCYDLRTKYNEETKSIITIGSSILQYATDGGCISNRLNNDEYRVYNLAMSGANPYTEMLQIPKLL